MSQSQFDVKTLTDDELQTRYVDLLSKIVYASRFGSGQAVGQLQNFLEQVDLERIERFQMSQWNRAKTVLEAPIESDPTLAAAAQAAREQTHDSTADIKVAQPAISRRPAVTRQPVVPADDVPLPPTPSTKEPA